MAAIQENDPMSRDFARQLRRNMTDAERRLWYPLRRRNIANCYFRRQAPIGPYVADFVCFERKLIIELDGGQHAERTEKDLARTCWLNGEGFDVLRFWNHLIFEDLDAVLETISLALERRDPAVTAPNDESAGGSPPPPSLTLPHEGGGDEVDH